jgi:SAM-dependent methyltransferase
MNLRLRRAVQREFGRMARAYARFPAPGAGREIRALLTWIGPRRDEQVLDAACGPARLARALAKHAGLVCGVDLCPSMIEVARQSQSHSRASVFLAVGDLERLPYRTRSFHLVTCSYAFANLPDALKALRELARVMRPNGRIAIVDLVAPDAPAPRDFLSRLETLRGHLRARILSRSQFRALFARAGLRLESSRFSRRRCRFRHWLRLSPAARHHPRRAQRLRRMLLASLDGDQGGLQARRLGRHLIFYHTTAWFMLRRKRRSLKQPPAPLAPRSKRRDQG